MFTCTWDAMSASATGFHAVFQHQSATPRMSLRGHRGLSYPLMQTWQPATSTFDFWQHWAACPGPDLSKALFTAKFLFFHSVWLKVNNKTGKSHTLHPPLLRAAKEKNTALLCISTFIHLCPHLGLSCIFSGRSSGEDTWDIREISVDLSLPANEGHGPSSTLSWTLLTLSYW